MGADGASFRIGPDAKPETDNGWKIGMPPNANFVERSVINWLNTPRELTSYELEEREANRRKWELERE